MSTSLENPPKSIASSARQTDATRNELEQLQHQLLQAEVRLAKARATVSGSEAEVKILNMQLRALVK